MPPSYPVRSALRHYQELALSSRLEAASPHQLVSMLYEELIVALDILNASWPKLATPGQASSILIALEASLDFDQGGALALNLASIYRAMHSELTQAVRHQDQSRLGRLREGAAELYTAWQQIK